MVTILSGLVLSLSIGGLLVWMLDPLSWADGLDCLVYDVGITTLLMPFLLHLLKA